LFWIPLIADPVELHLRDVRKPATENVAIGIRAELCASGTPSLSESDDSDTDAAAAAAQA
jgi:hypothetical protein